MPRQAHYPSREQRAQRAMVAAQHAATVQTISQVAAQTAALEDLNEAVGGDITALTTTLTEVGVELADALQRIEALENPEP